MGMNKKGRSVTASRWWRVSAGLLVTLSLALGSLALQAQKTPPAGPAVAGFEKRTKEYAKMRERIEGKMPNLPSESTPEKIHAHQEAFEKLVREARAGAKQGDIFTADIAAVIRQTIRAEFKGKDRQEIKETALEADTKGVPLRVNYPYPETKELSQTPPTLLQALPQLPKQLRYRFVGKHLLLVDRENSLIIDYMLNALP